MSTPREVFTVASGDGDGDGGNGNGNGLTVRAGNEIRVLKDVGNAVLVEVIGDQDNPYTVSPTLLASVCDFPTGNSREVGGP